MGSDGDPTYCFEIVIPNPVGIWAGPVGRRHSPYRVISPEATVSHAHCLSQR
ncbi:uncharacterized protein METZ01_LOCUS515828, partial [marine metagenome]